MAFIIEELINTFYSYLKGNTINPNNKDDDSYGHEKVLSKYRMSIVALTSDVEYGK